MDQLLTWVANGTHNYPSEDVLMTMQTLMEMIRQSKMNVLQDFMEQATIHWDFPQHTLGPLKLYVVPYNSLWDIVAHKWIRDLVAVRSIVFRQVRLSCRSAE